MARISSWLEVSANALTHRVKSGLRFAVCLLGVDLLALWCFGSGSASLFAAYAVVSLLYFCDFDGNLSERAISFSAAAGVGLLGVVVGVLAAPSMVVSLLLVGLVALLLALTRALLGNVAQGAIGLQLGILLAVMTPAIPGRLGTCVAAWCLGAAVAALAGTFVFPRHNARRASMALADWFTAAAAYAEALGAGAGVTSAHEGLVTAALRLDSAMGAVGNRPTWDTRRTRLLAEMMSEAMAATSTLAPDASSRERPALDAELGAATATSLRWCAAALEDPSASRDGLVSLVELRSRDLAATVKGLEGDSSASAADRIAAVEAHHALRALSVEALALRHRTEHLIGDKVLSDELGFPAVRSEPELLIATVSLRSLWLRHGIQAAVGMTSAVLIARLMGVDHAFWVAMTTLGLLNASYSPSTSRRGALLAGGGTVIGAGVGGVLLAFHPSLALIGLFTALAAYVMLQMASLASMGAQAAFTSFALLNTTFLGWPTRSHVVGFRLLDVAMGLVIGLGVMTLVFPGGALTIVTSCTSALKTRLATLRDATQAVVAGSGANGSAASAQGDVADELARLGSALRVLSSGELAPKRLAGLRAERQAGEAALLASALALSLCEPPAPPSSLPPLRDALAATEGSLVGAVEQALESDPSLLVSHAPQAVRALWAATWLDSMGAAPSPAT